MASGATGLACSMRTNSFLAGGGVALAPSQVWDRARLSCCHFLSVFGQVLFNGSAFLLI